MTACAVQLYSSGCHYPVALSFHAVGAAELNRDDRRLSTSRIAVIREMVQAAPRGGPLRAPMSMKSSKQFCAVSNSAPLASGGTSQFRTRLYPAVDRLIGTLALSRDGLPSDSLDGEPVYVFVLLVSPQDHPGDHLQALEAVVRTMRNDDFVRQLRACQTREEIWALLENAAPNWYFVGQTSSLSRHDGRVPVLRIGGDPVKVRRGATHVGQRRRNRTGTAGHEPARNSFARTDPSVSADVPPDMEPPSASDATPSPTKETARCAERFAW